ncbi:hypothetical protein [Mucilaginibacter sp.]|uniref:hypothetical protein n=1 Tax=Mucilaginibacter sp. TaxID=1882438 RepID=UPI00262FA865|nr:hypothetical protein [Mucilaginibacter sp.]MDB4922071.1 hypothetical protein [Mucilaginibacter sp.]
MPPETNFNALFADYRDMAKCLFAIQGLSDSGAFSGHPEVQQMLRVFEQNTLLKLYIRAITILQRIDGIVLPPNFPSGDFDYIDFADYDFNDGDVNVAGDFSALEYTNDFLLAYFDTTNNSFSSFFQTILNILYELQRKIDQITPNELTGLDNALVDVIDAFETIKAYLITIGLSPCLPSGTLYANNSPELYLQAAGSTGADGAAPGILLRWALSGELGLNHLPKGSADDAIATPALFNQPDDYVRLYRTPYVQPAPCTLDFTAVRPSINYALKRWTYFINTSVNGKALSSKLTLTFTDAAIYDQLAVSVNPVTNYFNFLKAYSGIIQIEVANKTLFAASFEVVNDLAAPRGYIKIEAQCTPDLDDAAAEKVYARKSDKVSTGATKQVNITAENIQTLKVLMSPGCYFTSFTYETYNDFQAVTNAGDWTEVGNGFALSLTTDEVFTRLESPDYPVDHLWHQYKGGTTVNVANYKDKWSNGDENDPSISSVVTDYFSRSETDPRAMITLPDSNTDPGASGLQVSLVDMLNMVSTDYHIARMLGLGFIDATAPDEFYIYRASYTNRAALNNPGALTRSYMTLPTARFNDRLPLQPEIRPVSYGLPVLDNLVSTAFDVHGYARYAQTRAINIGRQLFNDEIDGYDFFADLTQSDNTNIFINSRPVSYGIRYRAAADLNFQKPEITQSLAPGPLYYAYDPDFPVTGVPETVPVPDNEVSLYVHLETNPGVHYYAIYGINWFSRTSAPSVEVATDDTEFSPQNRLLSPTDVAVQYIQDEDTLVFTTTQEQEWLAGRATTFPGQDINFTRIVFNWLDIVDISSLPDILPATLAKAIRPNTVNVFFDPDLPIEVQGMVKNIAAVPGQDGQLQLYTGTYTQIDGTVLSPVIDTSAFFRFNNSLLNTPQGQFVVTGITAGTDGPVITVNKIVQNNLQEDAQLQGSYGLVRTYQSPLIGSQFSMVENLSNAANWQPVTEQISLHSFADPEAVVIEDFTDSGGNYTKNWIGGLSWDAVITPVLSNDSPPAILAGYYQLAFTQSLAPNPQINTPFDSLHPDNNAPGTLHTPHVEWYKGWCRIDTVSGSDKKQLEVLRIVQADPLVLIIYDPAYLDDPIPVSSSGSDGILVNFHPGYRAYVFAEPAPHAFNGSNILPAGNQISLKTMIGLQTADTRPGGSGFTSTVSSPAILLARLIVQPVKLAPPVISFFVVRPNATGKAALTFDITVPPTADQSARSPFGFKFCRTSEEDVLHALYIPSTVSEILASLAGLTDDPNYNRRYWELVNLEFDPENPGAFRVFNATPNSYGFPVPDNFPPSDPPDSLDEKTQKYSLAIQGTILPLTATTPIFIFIKTGFQTENSQPVIRDANGKLLDPSDPAFDPFPMIRQYTKNDVPNTSYVRFTDYTLNASSRSLYFYAAAEVTNQLVPGPLSGFAGPVTIVDTTPPEPPVVRTFSIVPSAAVVTSPISIVFQVSPTAPYDNIAKMRFYRTTDITLTGALATMGMPAEVEVSDPDQMGYVLTDTLSDIVNIPFGQPLYYRLASVRAIINELNLPEEVVSIGAEVLTINLIDTVNPAAPQLTYNGSDNSLSWTTNVNKGTYYLYQQNAKGNWTLLHTDHTSQPGQVVHFTPPAFVTTDGDGNRIYNRFKVRVQNASGLFNLTDNILTV